MLSAISLSIYEFRKYLVLSLVISILAIPIAGAMVIERDRNRNEMYGEAFWIYGFGVYNMTDQELAEALPPEWDFNDGEHVLPGYLGNITYEYPVFGLIFFAIATWLFPGVNDLQPLWINFVLVLVFNLNLVLIAILLRDKIYKVQWARLFFAGYFIYGLVMSAGGGKLEPIVDCLLLMALVLQKEGQMKKAMLTLGLSVQTKIYSGVAFPLMFLSAPGSSIWFFLSSLLTIIPFTFFGASFDSLMSHFFNTSSYSTEIVNPMYPGLLFTSPTKGPLAGVTYLWPPALIPLVIYIAFMLLTVGKYLPQKEKLIEASWREKLNLLVPLYIYMLPAILFYFRWEMPWYVFWLGPIAIFLKDDEQAMGYLRQIALVALLYTIGVFINWPYFIAGPLPDFSEHFKTGWWALGGLALMIGLAGASYFLWKATFDRRERIAARRHDAEARGELII